MSDQLQGDLAGGCLCGVVRYSLRAGFRMRPYACHCTDCQTRTGSAFSEHMLVMLSDLDVTGDLDCGEFVQPSGARSRIFGCAVCKARVYATNDQREGMATLRCGTLDASASLIPAAHIWISSKQAWIGLPDDAVTMDEQPRTSEEWMALVGPR